MKNLLFFLSLLLSSCFAAGQDTTFIVKSKTFEDGSFVVERYSARISFQADSLGVLDDSDDNILSIIKKDFIDIDEAASKYQHYYLFCGNNSIRVVASNYIMLPKLLSKLLGFIIIDGRISMVINWENETPSDSNALILNTFIRTGAKRLFSYREHGTIYSDGESSFFFPHFPEDDEPSITLFQITSSPYSKWRVQIEPFKYENDANGNMTSDGRRNMTFTWNHLNLPATIENNDGEGTTVSYTYLADGTKVLAQASGTNEGYAYLGTMVYKLVSGSWILETTPFTGGRFVRNAMGSFVEQRHITDHLGSTRAIVEGDNYTEVEKNDYYPFGKRIADNTLPTTPTNRWRFSGKEIQTLGGINLIDYGARLYDEDAVKWKSQDPMADSYLGLTPYGYCAGNPVSIVDPTGKEWKDIKGNPIDNHEKIRVYIFYDPMSFEKQSKHMYDKAIKQYGKGSAALSDVTSEKAFVEDWASMSSNSISEVDLNYHGNNQTLIMNPSESEYITSTGDGLTNVLGNSATNVQDLPNPQGDISNAQLNINSCKSNSKTQYQLKGSGLTLMESFRQQFEFKTVRGTASSVSYYYISKKPFPGSHGNRGSWDYMGNNQ